MLLDLHLSSVRLLALPPLATAAAILALGLITLRGERGSRVSVAFVVMTAMAAGWLCTLGGAMATTDPGVARWMIKAMYLAVPFIPPAVYLFTTVVLDTYPRRRPLVWAGWALGAAFCVAIEGSDALFSELYRFPWGFFPKFRWLSGPFLVYFVGMLLLSFQLYRAAERASPPGTTFHQRARAFRLAFGVSYVALVDFLPAFGVPIYPFGFLPVLGFVGLAARAVVRYRLVDVTAALAATQILQSMTDALLVLDAEGIVRVVNRAAMKLLGRGEADLIGCTAAGLVDDPRWQATIERLRDAERPKTAEIPFRGNTAERKTLSLSGSTQRDRDGGTVAVVIVIRDLTERVEQEEQLRRQARELHDAYEELAHTQAQLVRQERLAALGVMASGIAHNFSNALTPIVGYSEVLLTSPDLLADRKQVAEWLRVINQAGHDAAHILARLREFYRPADDAPVAIPTDLNAVIADVIDLTRPRWFDQALQSGQIVDVRTELSSIPPVAADPSDLREALTNLIFNALDALPADGTITLRTRPAGPSVIVEVVDTGTGMSEEVRRQCLEPFFTTKGPRGTGLGLSTVYGVVRRIGGSVEIASALGRGTSVTLTLPGQRHEAVFSGPTASVCAPLRILVIDDDARVREVVRCHLAADGHLVEEAATGAEGLARWRTDRFDVVIVDRSEPGTSGDRIAAAIKEEVPETGILMLTGYGELMTAANERPAGVDFVLGKPVTREGLRGALARLHRRETDGTTPRELVSKYNVERIR